MEKCEILRHLWCQTTTTSIPPEDITIYRVRTEFINFQQQKNLRIHINLLYLILQLLVYGQSFLIPPGGEVRLLVGGGGPLDGGHHRLQNPPLDVGEIQGGAGQGQLVLGQNHVTQRGAVTCSHSFSLNDVSDINRALHLHGK